MQCAWSDVLTTSTARMLPPYSWSMRVKMRSAPERSTRTVMPGYFASNVLPSRSANGEIHGGVEGELALLLRRLDQRGRDRRRLRRRRAQRGSKTVGRQRGSGLEHVAPGETKLGHGFLPWTRRVGKIACRARRVRRADLAHANPVLRGFAHPTRSACPSASHPEQLAVARLDLLARLLHAGRIVLHLLDLGERPSSRLLLGQRMDRAQPADVDDELLRTPARSRSSGTAAPHSDWAHS